MKTEAWTQILHTLATITRQAGEEIVERITTPVNLTVLPDGGNQSSPHLWGIMFEEMDHSGDGGIHGNLLQNNGFQGSDTGLTGYKAIGNAHISESPTPLSDAITSTLALSVRSDATGFVGFANTGYKGVPVLDATYSSTFWMKGEYDGTVMLRLVNSEDGTVYASHNVTVEKSRQEFEEYHATFDADASPTGDNEWQLLVDAEKAKGHILRFGLVQLFPPTWNDRANGLRADIIQPIYDLNPKFLRFPGGNNIEGIDVDSRWKWNETIGPVVNRPGRDTPWHYPNTDALGLDEYLWWCEDMGMTPVLTVWDGKSYDEILSGDDLHPYLDDILDELEYLRGPTNTTYGSLRAENGREEPWQVQYIEIGNEDDYTGGCATYPDRLIQIYNTIHDAYPNLTLIVDNMNPNCLPEEPLPDVMYDFHYYRTPDVLVDMFNYWDNQPRDQPVIVGEFGCRNHSDPDGLFWAFVKGSCSEAVHMIGMERNSDAVLMAAYAPLLQHFGYMQWSPTLFGFDSNPDSLTLSTSYYVQKMFATNHGTKIHPVESDSGFGPIYWVASSNDTHYQIKLANYNPENHTVNVQVPGAKNETGSLEMLAGEENASNQPHDIVVTPTVDEIKNGSAGFTVHMPPYGVAVLVVS